MRKLESRDRSTRLKSTGWILAIVIAVLFAASACFIAFNGHKSRTVLHSDLRMGGEAFRVELRRS